MIDTTSFLTGTAFYARISDEKIGGTYMTLLATLNNLGNKYFHVLLYFLMSKKFCWFHKGVMYPSTVGLYLTNWLTFRRCRLDQFKLNLNSTTYQAFNKTSTLTSFLFNKTISLNGTALQENTCSTIKDCQNEAVQSCFITVDAFYILSIIFFTIGFIYHVVFRKLVSNLSDLPKSAWKLKKI